MGNLVDQLRSEAVTDHVAYTEFMLQYRKGDDTLYCFFEGYEDRTYYSIRIKNISNANKYADYICGGKDEVLKVHNLVKTSSHYKNVKAGFFIDRDFDNLEYPEDVYVTPTYSIENLYCHKETFENILIAEFKMNRSDNDFVKCVDSYISMQEIFNNETLLLNAWLACQADLRNQSGSKERLYIDRKTKTLFDKIVLPDLSGIKNVPNIQTKEEIEKIFSDAKPVDNNTLFKKAAIYKTRNQSEIFRGKFLLRFLEAFLCKLQLLIGTANSKFEKKFSCSLRFEAATLCSGLSQYVITPDCLKDYIKKVSA